MQILIFLFIYRNFNSSVTNKDVKDMEIEQDSIEIDEVIKTGTSNDQQTKSSLKSKSGKSMPKIVDMRIQPVMHMELQNNYIQFI